MGRLLGPGLGIEVLSRTLGHWGVALRCEKLQLEPVKELGIAWGFIFPREEESVTEEHAGSCLICRKSVLEMEPYRKPGLRHNELCFLILKSPKCQGSRVSTGSRE